MRDFFYRMRCGFQRFMAGRYGQDKLNNILLAVGILFEILYSITGLLVFSLLSLVLLGLCIFRMFSRNITKRYNENQKLLKALARLKMRKNYHIYRCKSCGQRIRVPRKGGKKVEIRCPKCGNTFIKKI